MSASRGMKNDMLGKMRTFDLVFLHLSPPCYADPFYLPDPVEEAELSSLPIPQYLLNLILTPSHPSSAGRQSMKKAKFGIFIVSSGLGDSLDEAEGEGGS